MPPQAVSPAPEPKLRRTLSRRPSLAASGTTGPRPSHRAAGRQRRPRDAGIGPRAAIACGGADRCGRRRRRLGDSRGAGGEMGGRPGGRRSRGGTDRRSHGAGLVRDIAGRRSSRRFHRRSRWHGQRRGSRIIVPTRLSHPHRMPCAGQVRRLRWVPPGMQSQHLLNLLVFRLGRVAPWMTRRRRRQGDARERRRRRHERRQLDAGRGRQVSHRRSHPRHRIDMVVG